MLVVDKISDESMLVVNKIIYLFECKERSQKELAEYLNIPENKISEWKSGKTKSYKKYILKIAEFFNVSTDYLLNDNIPIKKNISVLSNAEIISNNIYSIPVYESVSAGFGATAISTPVGYYPMYIENPSEANDIFCVMVTGDSMYPIINDGDMIVVHKQPEVNNSQIAVVYNKDSDDAFVKKISYGDNSIDLISINPMYPPLHFEGDKMNDICIEGLVIQVIKNVC